eukprot:gene16762-19930_t
MGGTRSSSSNKKSIKDYLKKAKISYINVTLYTAITVVFILNLISVILETKDEFDLQTLESLIDKQVVSDAVLQSVATIHQRLHNAYYRYGISAGRQIFERFGKQLSLEQSKEINWMLGKQ